MWSAQSTEKGRGYRKEVRCVGADERGWMAREWRMEKKRKGAIVCRRKGAMVA